MKRSDVDKILGKASKREQLIKEQSPYVKPIWAIRLGSVLPTMAQIEELRETTWREF